MPLVPLLAARHRCCACLLRARSPSSSQRQSPPPQLWPLSPPLPAAQPSTWRFFRASLPLRTDVEATARKNHYERLGVRHDASGGDIKRSFYRLSKTHHPDANPSDPSAADRFSLLSESYTLLSDPSRRAAYDRDVLRLHQTNHHHHSSHHHASHPRGSYSSAQAGGRSPSGLSRRRTTFRGPPPSFYRSGGWGAQSEKRRTAHDESTGFNGTSSSTSSTNHERHPGMGPGSDPFPQAHDDSSVPHFDRAAHRRTHEREDLRRRTRARRAWGDDGLEFEPQTSLAGHFAIVSGILAVTFLGPFLYLQLVGTRKKGGGGGRSEY